MSRCFFHLSTTKNFSNANQCFCTTVACLALILSACHASEGNGNDNIATSDTTAVTVAQASSFEPFNHIEQTREALSAVGIGQLGTWRDDMAGGYMSITPYYPFGNGMPSANLSYYLESNTVDAIQKLTLMLHVNHGDKKAALSEFAQTVSKTYSALGIAASPEVVNAAKSGKELRLDKKTHTEQIRLEKSKIETWFFEIKTQIPGFSASFPTLLLTKTSRYAPMPHHRR